MEILSNDKMMKKSMKNEKITSDKPKQHKMRIFAHYLTYIFKKFAKFAKFTV